MSFAKETHFVEKRDKSSETYSVELAGVSLPNLIYNASGPLCTTYEELEALRESPYCGAVLTKSCTLERRDGNEHPRVYIGEKSSINSTGLANEGYEYYSAWSSRAPERSVSAWSTSERREEKPYIISISGLSQEDNLKILSLTSGVNAVELNLSCPNIKGKSQLAYNFEDLEYFLEKVFEIGYKFSIGLKLPAYFDVSHFETMATIIDEFPIKYITCINSPSGLFLNGDSTVIRPNRGVGGVGGSIVKPFGLANVKRFHDLLGDKIDIVGCGGVETGRDVYEYLLCGAKAVQIGTTFLREEHGCFERVTRELREILGERTPEDVRGALIEI